MQKFKILIATLLFYTISTYAITIDEKTPYLQIAISGDRTSSIFIGAYKDYLPQTTPKGDIVIRAMAVSNIETAGHPKGQQFEYVILANCKEQVAKILVIWRRDKEGSPSIPRYKLTGKELSDKIIEDMNKEIANSIEPGTMVSLVISSGCHYLGQDVPLAPKVKDKKQEWSA